MINITELIMGVDRWPMARRWLLEHYGNNAYLPQIAVSNDLDQVPTSQKFDERWALIPYAIEQPDGAQHAYFYLEFQDLADEMIFILRWL